MVLSPYQETIASAWPGDGCRAGPQDTGLHLHLPRFVIYSPSPLSVILLWGGDHHCPCYFSLRMPRITKASGLAWGTSRRESLPILEVADGLGSWAFRDVELAPIGARVALSSPTPTCPLLLGCRTKCTVLSICFPRCSGCRLNSPYSLILSNHTCLFIKTALETC